MFQLVDSYQHVCQSFTRHIRVCQHEKVGEKFGENRGKFISHQQFANVFANCFCAVHTHTNLQFVNTSLPTLVCRVKAAHYALIAKISVASPIVTNLLNI